MRNEMREWLQNRVQSLREGRQTMNQIEISVTKADGLKCERCRMVRESTGFSSKWPAICLRCADAEEHHARGKKQIMFYDEKGELMNFILVEDDAKWQEVLSFVYHLDGVDNDAKRT